MMFFLALLFLWQTPASELKPITFDHMFDRTFNARSVQRPNWMNDGTYFTAVSFNQEKGFSELRKTSILDNSFTVLVDEGELSEKNGGKRIPVSNYQFSADETKLLIATDVVQVWRRSYDAHYFIFDLTTRELKKLTSGEVRQSNAEFSPKGDLVAFTRDNNLFYVDVSTGKEVQITTDGMRNHIINGSTDWVYEEEFSFAKAWFWSPDGSMIAFYRFDESEVPEFDMQYWKLWYPETFTYKYPKAGEKNAVVKIGVYALSAAKTSWMNVGDETDQYIIRLNWTPQNQLAIRRMNRFQNEQDLLLANPTTGETSLLKKEKNKAWIEENDDLTFLNDKKHFIYVSEEDGYNHIYLYDMKGKLVRQITKGNWEVSQFVGIDEKAKTLYFMSTEVSPLERHLYSIKMDGKGKKKLTTFAGSNTITMSKDFKYYLSYVSNNDMPTRVSLHQADGKEVRVLEDNAPLLAKMKEYAIPTKEFVNVEVAPGVDLNGYYLKPTNFDPSKKYPVLMFVYGGPGSQQVRNSFDMSARTLWHMYLTTQGYVVVCFDNRGTGGRGEVFKKVTYKNLGKYETEDQIAAAKYLQSQAWVDGSRIGIWGWSYGGYMSSMALALGNDVFKAAIAVAPVTDWRFYDTIYTERYMQTPQTNLDGYISSAPLTHAKKIKGNYLLIHGTGDDNVHFHNAIEMVNELVKHNVQFETMYYPDRNHGIYGGNTQRHLYELKARFVKEKL